MVQIAVGDVVKIRNWHGVVLEVYYDELGQPSIIRVQTARNIFRNFGSEFIDVRMAPDAISPASGDDLRVEIEKRLQLQKSALDSLLDSIRAGVEVEL